MDWNISLSRERERERDGKQGRVEKRKLPWKRREHFTPIHVGINGKEHRLTRTHSYGAGDFFLFPYFFFLGFLMFPSIPPNILLAISGSQDFFYPLDQPTTKKKIPSHHHADNMCVGVCVWTKFFSFSIIF